MDGRLKPRDLQEKGGPSVAANVSKTDRVALSVREKNRP